MGMQNSTRVGDSGSRFSMAGEPVGLSFPCFPSSLGMVDRDM